MPKDTLSRRKESWIRRNQARVAAVVVAAAAVAGVGAMPASASTVSTAPAAQKIAGGVEDGTFRATCLSASTTTKTAPPRKVLAAKSWRKGMGATVVRVLVPWNIAVQPTSPQATCLLKYLELASKDKTTVEVSLNRRSDTKADDPGISDYRNAINALARLSKGGSLIGYLTAYNEPDNKSYFSDPHPASRAGHYYQIANGNKAFRGKVIAGDFAEPVTQSFLRGYIKAIGKSPAPIWAIHPYTDITNFQYFMHDHRTARQAAQAELTEKNSYVIQFAELLKNNGYQSSSIWLNEIYVTHRADRNPPPGVPGSKGHYNKKTHKWTGTTFSRVNQGYAGLFLDGGLGQDSLPGYLAAHGLPRLTRYVYMRAATKSLPEAYVLIVKQKGCLWSTFAGAASKPAANCK